MIATSSVDMRSTIVAAAAPGSAATRPIAVFNALLKARAGSGFSSAHLFHEHLGTSPQRYVVRQRMIRATQLLELTARARWRRSQ